MALYLGKDKIAGFFTDSRIGDTLPVGAIIDYDGEEVPANWELVEEKEQLNAIILKSTESTAITLGKIFEAIIIEGAEGNQFKINTPVYYELATTQNSAAVYSYLPLFRIFYDPEETNMLTLIFRTTVANGSRLEITITINNPKNNPTTFNLQRNTIKEIPSQEITFTVGSTSYTALRGMSWQEWVDSDYNTDGFLILDSNMVITSEARTLYVQEQTSNAHIFAHYCISGNTIYSVSNSPVPI